MQGAWRRAAVVAATCLCAARAAVALFRRPKRQRRLASESVSGGRAPRRVALCATGSVASVKVAEIARALAGRGVRVDLVLTASARSFLGVSYKGTTPWEELRALQASRSGAARELTILEDSDEWKAYSTVGADPVLHIEIAKRNSVLVFAPLSANTLAKLAMGLCDNLATCVARAWPCGLSTRWRDTKPVIVAPAMNTLMWEQKITQDHTAVLKRRGIRIIEPVVKRLACGDHGKGAMASVSEIVGAVMTALSEGT